MRYEAEERPTEHPMLGHYALIREAGRGGMSVVYEAHDDRIRRRVAVKAVTLPPHLTTGQRDELIARLRREARSVARLSHPNVVSVFDVGEQQGRHFLVMEYLEGETLRERLEAGPLPPDQAAGILSQVAAAVDAVHVQGVIHRDIKPSNVMLLPDGRAKLMDFGVARQADDTILTQTGMMVGSPAYMAPETINGDDTTRASDLWSLGVLLYQMLAGRPPFDTKNIPRALYQVTHTDPEPIRGASARVQQVIKRALEKEPLRRYPTASALADAFRAALPEPAQDVQRAAPERPHVLSPWLVGVVTPLILLSAVFLGHRLAVSRSIAPESSGSRPHAAVRRATATGRSVAKAAHGATATAGHRQPLVRVAEIRQETRRPSVPVPSRQPHRAASTTPRRPHPAVAARRPRRTARKLGSIPPRPTQSRAVPVRDIPVNVRLQRPNLPSPLSKDARTDLRRSTTTPKESPASTADSARTAQSLDGTWHGWQGIHGRDPATLRIRHSQEHRFDGVMTIRTPERATVRVAVEGQMAPDGSVSMQETRILSSTKPHAWDLGVKRGRLRRNGQMSGVDHDNRGREARWSFTR